MPLNFHKKPNSLDCRAVRSNALTAEQKVSAYFTRSISLGSDGADLAVSKVLALASKSLARVAANASRFEKATGLRALNTIATAAMPAAVAAHGVASRIEARSAELVQSLAGGKPATKRVASQRAVARKPRAGNTTV